MVSDRRNYSPSPILWPLAEYYIKSDAYSYWNGTPLEFRHLIKEYIIEYVNKSVDPFVRDLPFLKVTLPSKVERGNKCDLEFEGNLKEFLNSRKILKVTVWNIKGFKGSLTPVSSKQIGSRKGQELNEGGFDINLEYTFIHSLLTTFSHEIGHTYFYDISKNPPECLVSSSILETKKWYKQFEGLAFDLGREILLPREIFTRYVLEKFERPSLANFLSMHLELRISQDVLAQRLMKDLKLWQACVFWGIIDYSDMDFLGKRKSGPHIIVRDRDKRKGGFTDLNIKKELLNSNSDLRKTILGHINDGEAKSYEICLNDNKCKLDLETQELPEKKKWFVALLHF